MFEAARLACARVVSAIAARTQWFGRSWGLDSGIFVIGDVPLSCIQRKIDSRSYLCANTQTPVERRNAIDGWASVPEAMALNLKASYNFQVHPVMTAVATGQGGWEEDGERGRTCVRPLRLQARSSPGGNSCLNQRNCS